MRMPTVVPVLCALALALPSSALGSGSSSAPSPSSTIKVPETPDEIARRAYNNGVASHKRVDILQQKLDKETSDDKRAKLKKKIQKTYESMTQEFAQAVANKPTYYQAFSELGYSFRKLGQYGDSLAAYERALQLEPEYGPAIEYQAEAFLGLNRVEDAKTSYLKLFGMDRGLADELLEAIKGFVEKRRDAPNGVSEESLDELSTWVGERETIAKQTATNRTDADTARGTW